MHVEVFVLEGLTGEEPRKGVGGFHDGLVAGNVRHRAQGVEDLSSRHARNAVHSWKVRIKSGREKELWNQ